MNTTKEDKTPNPAEQDLDIIIGIIMHETRLADEWLALIREEITDVAEFDRRAKRIIHVSTQYSISQETILKILRAIIVADN